MVAEPRYTVEVFMHLERSEQRLLREAWDTLADGFSRPAVRGALQVLPAIQSTDDPEREGMVLRWVSLPAASAAEAGQQALQLLAAFAVILPALASPHIVATVSGEDV